MNGALHEHEHSSKNRNLKITLFSSIILNNEGREGISLAVDLREVHELLKNRKKCIII